MLRRGDEVLLSRRVNTGYQDGRYSLVAGPLDGDELARDGLAREAREEAGIAVEPDDLVLVHVAHRLSRSEPGQERLDLFFATERFAGEPRNLEPAKCDDLSWHPFAALPDGMLPFIRIVLGHVARGELYSEHVVEPA